MDTLQQLDDLSGSSIGPLDHSLAGAVSSLTVRA
jgi:hypothetical protein